MIACCLFEDVVAWSDLLAQLYGFSDRLESPREGLVFIKLGEGEARQLATSFSVAVGLSTSQEQAHLLALSAYAGEVVSDTSVATLPIGVLTGLELSPKTIQRLTWLGIETLGDLKKWSKTQLSLYLGTESKTLIRYLHGPFRREVARYVPAETLHTSFAFQDPVLEPARLGPIIRLLCERLSAELDSRAAAKLTLVAVSQGLTFSASRHSKQVLKGVDKLERLAHFALEDSGVLGLEVDELRLELTGLYRPSEQGRLWYQREQVQKAIDKVERRFPGAMLHFDEVNPYTPLSSFRFRLVKVGGGGEVYEPARGQHSKRSARQDRPAALSHS